MNRPISILLLSAFVAVGSVSATSQGQEKPRKGFLSVLKEGQSVGVKEVAGRYEITVMTNVRLAHKVIEVGPDHLTIEDIAGMTETRIPIYSIKSIVTLKIPESDETQLRRRVRSRNSTGLSPRKGP